MSLKSGRNRDLLTTTHYDEVEGDNDEHEKVPDDFNSLVRLHHF